MSYDIDTRLREQLRERIDQVPAPGPDLPGLVRRSRRAVLRRRAAGFAAAAVVTAVVIPVATLLPNDGGPATDLVDSGDFPVASGGALGPEPVPGPTGLFVTQDKVYLGGSVYDVRLPVDTGAHISGAGVAYPARGSGRPMLLGLDGKVTPLAPEEPAYTGAEYSGWIAADSASGLVAWVEYTEDAADIVAYDASSKDEVSRKRLPCGMDSWSTGCPTPYVVSNGVVFITVEQGTIAWDVAHDTSTDAFNGLPSQAHNRVVTGFEGERFPLPAELDGWVHADVPEDLEAILSYDGSWLLDANGGPTVVSWRDPAETIRYRVPGTMVAATFDTDGSVLAVSFDNGQYTGWDCAFDEPCQQVVAPQPAEIRLVAWDL
jgi:hypothetical protein